MRALAVLGLLAKICNNMFFELTGNAVDKTVHRQHLEQCIKGTLMQI